jgi:hypothetical protein
MAQAVVPGARDDSGVYNYKIWDDPSHNVKLWFGSFPFSENG